MLNITFVVGIVKNFSVLEDRKLHVNGLMSVKALLCFLKSLCGDVTVSSMCLADRSLNLKMFCPGFAMMLFERAKACFKRRPTAVLSWLDSL